MKRMLVVLAALGFSCGPPPPSTCCIPTVIARDFGYVGTYAADGGATTQVQLIVSASGAARISFLRGGNEIVETFQTSPR